MKNKKGFIKNKKGFLARDFVIILVLFGAVTTLGYLMVVDISSSETGYNITNMTDESFRENYDTLTASASDIYEMQNATTSEEKMTVVSTFTTMFKSTFSVISIVFGSFSMVKNTFTNFAGDFGVPSVVANIAFTAFFVILIAMIIFIIISSVSKGKM